MGSSSSAVNYGVRQNKAIERSVMFGGLRALAHVLPWSDCVYIGLGSAWFVDFDMAHRELGIETMISIEADPVTYARAEYNRPFRTVQVIPGYSYDETAKLLDDEDLRSRPWIVWLDYDERLDQNKVEELQALVRRAPANSVVLATFNAHGGSYGRDAPARFEAFSKLLGDAFPAELHPGGRGLNKHQTVQRMLGQSVVELLVSTGLKSARHGRVWPAFNLRYQDGAPMVTVGVVLPAEDRANDVRAVLDLSSWRCADDAEIASPALTSREIAALRSLMPADSPPGRSEVQALGFDLEEPEIASFAKYYLDYPIWAQVTR